MSLPQPGKRQAIMFVTRCGCKRIKTVQCDSVWPMRTLVKMRAPAMRASTSAAEVVVSERRFEHRGEFDKETGLPIYFEEGYYA